MIFTWDTTNLCIVFDWWQIKGPLSLIISLVGVALLTAGYEAVREASRRYDQKSLEGVNRLPRKSYLLCQFTSSASLSSTFVSSRPTSMSASP